MIISFYAAILALLFVALSVYVILGRAKYKVLIGEGTSPDMLRRIRAQGNFIEYTPLFLILLLLRGREGFVASFPLPPPAIVMVQLLLLLTLLSPGLHAAVISSQRLLLVLAGVLALRLRMQLFITTEEWVCPRYGLDPPSDSPPS